MEQFTPEQRAGLLVEQGKIRITISPEIPHTGFRYNFEDNTITILAKDENGVRKCLHELNERGLIEKCAGEEITAI